MAARYESVKGTRSAPGEAHARLVGVTKVFPAVGKHAPVHALGPIDLTVTKGEFLAVVGPSGCGKSTLLDILAGLSMPTEGMAQFEGKPISGQVPPGIGVVFQEDSSFPWLTVSDNVAFGLRRAGFERSEIAKRVDHALHFMGLADFAKAHPAHLSGGMRQRVCIARTLVLEPRLILLDEPFGALDQQTRLLMGDELLRLWRATGATIVLITHAIDEASMLADRVGVMTARPGRFADIAVTGWPRERDSRIVSDPAFGGLTGRVWEILREESIKAIGHRELGGRQT
jgi:NitT/TauT family transport system ATP-binding protein